MDESLAPAHPVLHGLDELVVLFGHYAVNAFILLHHVLERLLQLHQRSDLHYYYQRRQFSKFQTPSINNHKHQIKKIITPSSLLFPMPRTPLRLPFVHAVTEISYEAGHLLAFQLISIKLFHILEQHCCQLQLLLHHHNFFFRLDVKGEEEGGRLIKRIVFGYEYALVYSK